MNERTAVLVLTVAIVATLALLAARAATDSAQQKRCDVTQLRPVRP